ncbi:flagellar biosynthesis regulator FlaF [Salipiger sp. PrR003]|uniref:flagellar biosynthesis regulator FlaF n=1 Tax=Salipiger sp. PrR003 TaxID=2706776 RepID=UPI0013D92F1F|nr:flagellar biosynthesis regulator FlaF [Salipiger sp. PrR003]NDV50788.1 flagellar biosynthesis regulator FlaF [Salipiger sp. PrR003]
MSVSAYKKTIRNTETPREIERRIMSRITNKLSKVQADFDKADNLKQAITADVREAIYENQQLWITVKADLMADGNQLSAQLRADLISLAMWVDRQSDAVLGGEGRIAPLIEVNQNIMNGLSGKK